MSSDIEKWNQLGHVGCCRCSQHLGIINISGIPGPMCGKCVQKYIKLHIVFQQINDKGEIEYTKYPKDKKRYIYKDFMEEDI